MSADKLFRAPPARPSVAGKRHTSVIWISSLLPAFGFQSDSVPLTFTMVRSNAREEKVLLSSIKSLTFQDGKLTNARRSKPIRENHRYVCRLFYPR